MTTFLQVCKNVRDIRGQLNLSIVEQRDTVVRTLVLIGEGLNIGAAKKELCRRWRDTGDRCQGHCYFKTSALKECLK